jgi:hypothetical protein
VFVALWTLGTALEDRPAERGKALAWWLGLGTWTAFVAIGLGAVQLLPGIEASLQASRSAGVAVSGQLLLDGVRSVVGLVGPPLTDEPNSWENRAGLGVLWLTLTLAAPALGGRRVRFEAAVCLVLFLFVLGGAALVQWLPGFRLFRLPSRMFLVAALPLALLAGRSVDAILADGPDAEAFRARCQRFLLKVTGVVFFLAAVFALAIRSRGGDIGLRFHPYWLTLLLTVPSAWLLLRPGKGPAIRPNLRHAAWLTVLTVDVGALTWQLVDVRPQETLYSPSGCVRYLANRRADHGRILDFNPDTYATAANHTPLWPGLPVVEQIEGIRGFNPIDVLRYKEYLQLITDEDRPLRPLDQMYTGPLLGTFAIKNQTLADLLGIRFLLQPADLALDTTVQTGEARRRWTLVADDPAPTTFNFISVTPGGADCGLQSLPPYRVYENAEVLPRAFIVADAALLPERSKVLDTLKATDFRRQVLLEGYDEASSGPKKATPTERKMRAVAVREYLPNRVTLEADAGAAGILVLADVWFPGWVCTVDGHQAPIYRANFLFRGVELPAGARRIVFTFDPLSYRWGKAVSSGTALLVGVMSLVAMAAWVLSRMETRSSRTEAHAVPC